MMLAPDVQRRKLAAVFTAEDTLCSCLTHDWAAVAHAGLELRLAISEIYRAVPTPPPPPPGAAGRAGALILVLQRGPPKSKVHYNGRAIMAHREHTERLGAPNPVLVAHGLDRTR